MSPATDELAQRLRGVQFLADAAESHLREMWGCEVNPRELHAAFDLIARELRECIDLLDEQRDQK